MKATIKSYYYLTKPGIIYGNVLAATAGFLLASSSYLSINILLFLTTLLGTALVIASSCVINNYIDREVDSRMKRTQKRAMVTGKIPVRSAIIFGTSLGVIGFLVLVVFTNWLVVLAGAIGMFFYLVPYSIAKRKSPVGTLVGTFPGAMPLVAGYVAVSSQIDTGVILLFLIMVFWQLPHFYSIGVYRINDYKDAGLPILPVKSGIKITRIHMVLCMILFLISALMLSILHFTGFVYFIVMLILGSRWLMMGIQGFKATDEVKWGKKVFKFSILVLMTFSVLLCLNIVLP